MLSQVVQRRRAEEDVQLLANRISLLKQEEQRARKRALAVRAETSKLRDHLAAREADKVTQSAIFP